MPDGDAMIQANKVLAVGAIVGIFFVIIVIYLSFQLQICQGARQSQECLEPLEEAGADEDETLEVPALVVAQLCASFCPFNKKCGEPSIILSNSPPSGSISFSFSLNEPFWQGSTDYSPFVFEKINLNTLDKQSEHLENLEMFFYYKTGQLVAELNTSGQTYFLYSKKKTWDPHVWHSARYEWGENGLKFFVDGELNDSHSFSGFMKPGNSSCFYLATNRDCVVYWDAEVKDFTIDVS